MYKITFIFAILRCRNIFLNTCIYWTTVSLFNFIIIEMTQMKEKQGEERISFPKREEGIIYP